MGLPVLSHPFSVAYFRTKSTASYVGQNLGSLIPFLVSGLKKVISSPNFLKAYEHTIMPFVFPEILSDLSLDIPSQFRQKRSKDQEPGPTCTLRGKFPLSAVITLQTFSWQHQCLILCCLKLMRLSIRLALFQTAYVVSLTWKNLMKQSCTIATSVKKDRNPLRSSGSRSCQRQKNRNS